MPNETNEQDAPTVVNVEVEGDAVVNTAPDGGGVDNNEAAPQEDTDADS